MSDTKAAEALAYNNSCRHLLMPLVFLGGVFILFFRCEWI